MPVTPAPRKTVPGSTVPASAAPPSRSRLNAASASPARPTINVTKPPLPGLPKRPLTPAEQAKALARTQSQAEQRVKLGVQLFKAAEAHASQRRDLLEQLKDEQAQLRQLIQEDIAKAMERYTARLDSFDDQITNSVHKLEDRISELQTQWTESQQRIEQMIARSETLLSQTRAKVDAPMTDAHVAPMPSLDVAADDLPNAEPEINTFPAGLQHLEREAELNEPTTPEEPPHAQSQHQPPTT